MHRPLMAGFLGGGLLVVGCSALPPAPTPPAGLHGTLEARVAIGDYRTQELMWDISTISCRVRQAGPEQRQELGQSQLELGAFSFRLAEGTASVRSEALNATGGVIGQAETLVGIRSGQVTLLRQVLEIGGSNDSFLHPLMPLPIRLP